MNSELLGRPAGLCCDGDVPLLSSNICVQFSRPEGFLLDLQTVAIGRESTFRQHPVDARQHDTSRVSVASGRAVHLAH
jgi:hypothetical protein